MKKTTFFVRIFLSLMAVILVASVVPAYYVLDNMKQNVLTDTEAQAFEKLEIMSLFFEVNNNNTLPKITYSEIEKELTPLHLRLTLIGATGEVLYDSQVRENFIENMDNHADRIEVKSAMQVGKGVSSRFSNTLNTNYIYVAKLLENGDILRIAYPQKNLKARIDTLQNTLIYVFVLAIFFALIIAFTLSYSIKKQLKSMIDVVDAISLGKLGSRLHQVPGQEFAVLASAVNRMAENIEQQLDIMHDQAIRLQVIFNTMPDGILLLDSKGNIRQSNKALRDIAPKILDKVKYTPESNYGIDEIDITPESVNIQIIECIKSPILQNAVEIILKENTNLSKMGMADTFLTCNQPDSKIGHLTYYLELELFTGRFFGIYLAKPQNPTPTMGLVLVIHEITEIIHLENVRRDFVANVSHELRTPLTSIQGYAETLATMPELSENSKRFAQTIYKHGSYLNNMIEDLLALARIENTQEEYILTSIDPKDAFITASDFCEKNLQKNNLNLINTLEKDLNKTKILANPEHLERVFRNLLENACRYALPNSTIHAFAKKEDIFTLFTIENKGALIPEEDIERIFERFYRVEKGRNVSNNFQDSPQENMNSGQTNGTATGLGLAICKHIIERHGGRIWAQSIQENNSNIATTAFHFTLKLEN